MDFLNNFPPYDPLFDKNHDGRIDWLEEDTRQDFEDFMNKRGAYEERSLSDDDDVFDDDDLDDDDDF